MGAAAAQSWAGAAELVVGVGTHGEGAASWGVEAAVAAAQLLPIHRFHQQEEQEEAMVAEVVDSNLHWGAEERLSLLPSARPSQVQNPLLVEVACLVLRKRREDSF